MPLLLVSTHSLARIVDNGEQANINSGTVTDNYLVRNSSSLTANGATTEQIRVQGDSALTLNNSTVVSNGSSIGVDLVNSRATVSGSNITGTTTGLLLGYTGANPSGSTATVTGSNIVGGTIGALVGGFSQLTLENSVVAATNPTGFGLQLANGQVSAKGSVIRGGTSGVRFTSDQNTAGPARLDLDATRVEGQTGSAIIINNGSQPPINAQITVANGSTLVGGNGTMLEVKGTSSANLTADNSQLVGNVVADAGATANVTLQNQATLTGQLVNVNSLAVNSGAQWNMVGDGSVANLSMDGGSVNFGGPADFYKLTVGNLSGSGMFIMHADFATGQVDTLEVTGTATGNHIVDMNSSGAEPAGIAIPVIRVASGDAQFSLRNGPVDLGTYSYRLLQQDANNWYLDPQSKVISPGTQSVLALFNTAPTVWYGELSTLRSRMGEVRMDNGKAGGWIRAYGNKFDVSADSGLAYQQTQQGLSFGADAPLPFGNGQWLVGLLGGYSKSDLDLSHGTSGTVDSYYMGAYTTWLHDNGYYFDGVIKYNHFRNKSDVQLSDGKKAKGDYDNNGIGGSLEVGRHIKLANNYFVEPYTQLSGVIIEGTDYSLDNGLTAEGDRTRSLLGEVGATVGRNFYLGKGKVVQPYLRAAYVHEFAKNNEVQVNNNVFNNDLSGSRGELGAGLALSIAEKWQVHTDLDYSNGDKIEQPWGVNFGLRYSWN